MSIYPNIKVCDDANDTQSTVSQKKVLYFSDGTLEVDELDGDVPTEIMTNSAPVDPQQLTWGPWMWYQTITAGSKALEVCDYVGESLASFFGITTPKYQFELNEYYRIKKEEEEEAAQNDIEMGSWTKKVNMDEKDNSTISTGPKGFNKGSDFSLNNS